MKRANGLEIPEDALFIKVEELKNSSNSEIRLYNLIPSTLPLKELKTKRI